MVNKNDIFEVKIEDIGSDGEGIGKIDGYTLFIKDAVIGDTVKAKVMKAKKNYAYARLMEVVIPSPHRVTPKCDKANQCGGCQIQPLSYEKQLEFKQKKVANNLERIGKITDYTMQPIIGMEEPYKYRNKAQFPVGMSQTGEIVTGFYAGRTHTIIDNTVCCLGADVNEQILNIVKDYMKAENIAPYNELSHTGIVRHILTRVGFKTGEIMVCLICNGKKLKNVDKLITRLLEIKGMTSISINVNTDKTNRILGNEIINLYGEGYITDYIDDIKYQISPLSFYQVNPIQTDKLYKTALEYADLSGDETVWDLYCGIGTISLFLTKKAKKVYGVEIIEAAIDDARRNAAINNIDNVEFYVGKAEEVLPEMYEKNNVSADVIVVDPPRKGCEEVLLDTIVKMAPKKVVYVSCDSATLARDLNYLTARGYKVEKVRAVDMFPQTVHVESVCLMTRKEK